MADTSESMRRVAYSPKELGLIFGKSQTWGYRQIYAGKVQAITEYGRILIPASEVERILEKAGIYNGREKPKAAKERAGRLNAEQKSVWQRYLEMRSQAPAENGRGGMKNPALDPKQVEKSREGTLGRITRRWRGRKER